MSYEIKLKHCPDGSFDLIVDFSRLDTEFGEDFLSQNLPLSLWQRVSDFLLKQKRDIKINAVKIAISGIIVSSIAFHELGFCSSSMTRYSMAYVFFGTPSQQLDSIAKTKGNLQTIAPCFFTLNQDGQLQSAIDQTIVDNAHAGGMKVVPFLTDDWNRTAGSNALQQGDTLAAQIATLISEHHLDGINIDIENVTEQYADQYVNFIKRLRELIPAEKEVSVAVAANPKGYTVGWQGSYDYTQLAKYADYLMVMAYDESWPGSPSGPVAGQPFVDSTIQYALSKTTPDKIVLGLPFYGRIWSDDGTFNGNGAPMLQIEKIVQYYHANVTYDTLQKSVKAEFTVPPDDVKFNAYGKTLNAGRYTVWYENSQSLEAKMSLIQHYNLKGAGSWALGQEDTSVWNDYDAWLNGAQSVNTTTKPPASSSKASVASKASKPVQKTVSNPVASIAKTTSVVTSGVPQNAYTPAIPDTSSAISSSFSAPAVPATSSVPSSSSSDQSALLKDAPMSKDDDSVPKKKSKNLPAESLNLPEEKQKTASLKFKSTRRKAKE